MTPTPNKQLWAFALEMERLFGERAIGIAEKRIDALLEWEESDQAELWSLILGRIEALLSNHSPARGLN